MSIDARIVKALNPLGLVIEKSVYNGQSKRYITFNYDTVPILHADDAPCGEKYLIQVHYFAPLNYKILDDVKQIKQCLFDADFTFAETTDASDDNGFHIVFEFEDVEGFDDGEI